MCKTGQALACFVHLPDIGSGGGPGIDSDTSSVDMHYSNHC